MRPAIPCATPIFPPYHGGVAGGRSEGRPLGRDGGLWPGSALGLVSAVTAVQSFGRYIVQASGTASRIALERLHEAVVPRPKVREMVLRFTEAMMARDLQIVACNAVHSVEARVLPLDPQHA